MDKNIDHPKAQQQIGLSSFIELNHDPIYTHIWKVKEWADKSKSRREITKEWYHYTISNEAQQGKNSTLYKIHKEGNAIKLLTTGCSTAIENLSRFIKKITIHRLDKLINNERINNWWIIGGLFFMEATGTILF